MSKIPTKDWASLSIQRHPFIQVASVRFFLHHRLDLTAIECHINEIIQYLCIKLLAWYSSHLCTFLCEQLILLLNNPLQNSLSLAFDCVYFLPILNKKHCNLSWILKVNRWARWNGSKVTKADNFRSGGQCKWPYCM